MRNIASDAGIFSDTKRLESSGSKTKLTEEYDFFTGDNVQRRVQIPLKEKKQKSSYEKMTEIRPNGFGRTMGICVKSIDKGGSTVD